MEKKKEENCEIFEIEKDGKKKVVESCNTEKIPNEKIPKKEIDKENKILRNIFIGVGIVIILIIAVVIASREIKHYNYQGVDFETVKFGDLIVYKTSLPIVYKNQSAEYEFYLRTPPKQLENVKFNGNITLKKFVVINTTNKLTCEGYGSLAIANLAKLYNVLGAQVMSDKNASCDWLGSYTYINIIEGNETKVEQYGPSCYRISVNNCEVLPATEKLMAETFVEINK
jgi:hypothetical protein